MESILLSTGIMGLTAMTVILGIIVIGLCRLIAYSALIGR